MITKIYKRVKHKSGGAPAKRAEVEARAGRAFPSPLPPSCPPRPSVIFQNSASGFSLKKVRISFRIDSQFVKFLFPASLGASPLASANEFASNFQTSQSFFALRANAKRQLFRHRRNCPKAI